MQKCIDEKEIIFSVRLFLKFFKYASLLEVRYAFAYVGHYCRHIRLNYFFDYCNFACALFNYFFSKVFMRGD